MLIETNRLCLREFVAEDLAAVLAYRSLPEVKRFDNFGPNSEGEVRDLLRKALAWRDQVPRMMYFGAVCLKASNGLVGEFILRIAADTASAEVGFMFGPFHWGRGYARETLGALMDFGAGLGLKRLTGTCDLRNAAAIRVMESVGMVRHDEGDRTARFSIDLAAGQSPAATA